MAAPVEIKVMEAPTGEEAHPPAAESTFRVQQIRFIRQPKAASGEAAEEDATKLQSPREQSFPGQVSPAGNGERAPSPRGPAAAALKRQNSPEVTTLSPKPSSPKVQKASPKKQAKAAPERAGKTKRPDEQTERYQQHLAYLKGLGSNAYRMAVEEGPSPGGSGPGGGASPKPEEGEVEAELTAMLQGLKEDLQQKVPKLPEVETLDKTASTLADHERESQQSEDSQSETSGAGGRPGSLPAPSTVEDLSQAMDQEVWNKLKQQLRSLESNIQEITAKFAPKTGTLRSSEGTCTQPKLYTETDMRHLLHQQQMSQLHAGRFQPVFQSQQPVTPPLSSSSGSSMQQPALWQWRLQSQMPEDVPSSATSQSSASYAQACSGGPMTQGVALRGFEADMLRQPSRAVLCQPMPGCTRSTTSLNSALPITPRSARITSIIGTPNSGTGPHQTGALSPGRPFAIVRPVTPQVLTPRLSGSRRVVQSPAGYEVTGFSL